MQAEMIALRLIHIVFGVVWAGWAISMWLFVEPAARAAGLAGGPFMQALTSKTKLLLLMTLSPILVILSGSRLLWIVSGGLDGAWMSTQYGMCLTLGSAIGIGVFFFGLFVMRPAGMRMAQISSAIQASGQPPTEQQSADMNSVRQTLRSGGRIAGIGLSITVALMSVARYLPIGN